MLSLKYNISLTYKILVSLCKNIIFVKLPKGKHIIQVYKYLCLFLKIYRRTFLWILYLFYIIHNREWIFYLLYLIDSQRWRVLSLARRRMMLLQLLEFSFERWFICMRWWRQSFLIETVGSLIIFSECCGGYMIHHYNSVVQHIHIWMGK